MCQGKRDIGVHISSDLKPGTQCSEAARQANAILTQISRAFMYRDKRVFLQLYKQFVRCHLEFGTPAWSPWQAGDIQVLEQVPNRAVRLVNGLQGTTYEDWLEELGLRTLEDRRNRIDLIQTFKILNRFDKVDYRTWFSIVGILEGTFSQTGNTSVECSPRVCERIKNSEDVQRQTGQNNFNINFVPGSV